MFDANVIAWVSTEESVDVTPTPTNSTGSLPYSVTSMTAYHKGLRYKRHTHSA